MKIFAKIILLAGMCLGQSAVAAIPSKKVQERILWGIPISPYVRPVLITFYEKELSFTHHKIFPTALLQATGQEIPEDFKKASPFGKIPFYEELTQDAPRFGLGESAAIMDYLDASQRNNPLRPKDVKANALVSFFLAYATYTLAPVTHSVVIENVIKPAFLKLETDSVKVQKNLNDDLPPMLDFLERTLADKREWIAGTENFSIADIAIGSHLLTLDAAKMPGISIIELIGQDRPHLLAYYQKVVARDSFKRALQLQ